MSAVRYDITAALLDRLQACTGKITDASLVNSQFNFGEVRALIGAAREMLRIRDLLTEAEDQALRETERAEKLRDALEAVTSLAKEVKPQNTDEFMQLMVEGLAAAERIWESTADRELFEQDKERLYVGSTSRVITAMVQRVALAGEDPKVVVDDYGWEWGRGPDLSSIAELRAKALGLPAPASSEPDAEAKCDGAASGECSAHVICRAWLHCSDAMKNMENAFRCSPTEENALNMVAAWESLILARQMFEGFEFPEQAGMTVAS